MKQNDVLIAKFLNYSDKWVNDYHVDFLMDLNYLFLAVEKIESMKHPISIYSNNCTIYECKDFKTEKGHWVIDEYGNNKREAIYNAVVKFITGKT